MKLPNGEHAVVPLPKLVGYLLSEAHPVGRTKARYLRAAGFNESNADLLEQGLLVIARTEEVVDIEPSPYGMKYVVDGALPMPEGGSVRLRTVWVVETGQDLPRFVTAYPA